GRRRWYIERFHAEVLVRALRSLVPATLAVFATLTAAGTPAVRAADAPPTLAARSAGLERHDGFVPFYWDARSRQLLLEVSRWDQEFLYGAGLAGGAGLIEVTLDRGQTGGLGLCRFQRVGPRVLPEQRQTTQRSGSSDREQSRVVEESFPSSVLAAMKIEAAE